ncbi:MAG: phosphoribosylamine--glycine ligase, partial [Spirochaetia bacterium]|nr:phosphoribosylamine--glycine ligase [Spirochaetia bacterium]
MKEPFTELEDFIRRAEIGLTVIGPEKYLMEGMADALQAKGHKVFGPVKAGAFLEGSKKYAKEIMKRAGVPTAGYEVFTDFESARKWLADRKPPFVLKADGLAAGKGVVIAGDLDAAESALKDFFLERKFGAAGSTVLIEEFLRGYEVSILAFTDGKDVRLLPPSQDHKRVFDNDEGPNTGGMGVYSPVPGLTEAHLRIVREKILLPTLAELKTDGVHYCGILYAGLMIDGDEVNVVEFNARFGDPETECVLPLLESDLVELFLSCAEGRLAGVDFRVAKKSSCTVIMASGGYPGDYAVGKKISGLESVKKSQVFHAGTSLSTGGVVSAGGRVLAVTHVADGLQEAISGTYADVNRIRFEGAFFRSDIG